MHTSSMSGQAKLDIKTLRNLNHARRAGQTAGGTKAEWTTSRSSPRSPGIEGEQWTDRQMHGRGQGHECGKR